MAVPRLTGEPVRMKNVPRVTDTQVMAQVLVSIGATCEGEGEITIDASGASAPRVPDDLGKRMRATILLLGALIGRFGSARLPRPGGADIGARRRAQDLRGLRQMGATISESATELVAHADRLRGARIVFDLPTVTGTENIP